MQIQTTEQPQTDRDFSRIAVLFDRAQQHHEDAAEELCQLMRNGIRFLVLKRCGYQDCEDAIQDVLVEVLRAIRQGKVQHPVALLAFARTVAVRRSAAYIDQIVNERTRVAGSIEDFELTASSCAADPESAYFQAERTKVAYRVLASMQPREQEILRRFYVEEQSAQEICQDMHLTETQFRLLKSRAKSRFGELGRAKSRRRVRTMPQSRIPNTSLQTARVA